MLVNKWRSYPTARCTFTYAKRYLKCMRVIYEGKLPMNKKSCYLIFNVIVEWFATYSTGTMWYRNETVKSWQFGKRLFHLKFVRCMSDVRNLERFKTMTPFVSNLPSVSENTVLLCQQPNNYAEKTLTWTIVYRYMRKHMETLSNVLC